MDRPTTGTALPRDTKVLFIGSHPGALDYSRMPDGIDEQALTTRIEVGNAALREAGFDVVACLIDTSRRSWPVCAVRGARSRTWWVRSRAASCSDAVPPS